MMSALHLGKQQLGLYRAGNATGDPILQIENVFKVAVEPLAPNMQRRRCVDQLTSDAHAVAGLPDRAFEHIADP